MKTRISYWVLPVVSCLVWLSMLLVMLIYWILDTGREHYISMADTSNIAYISDIGASTLKPLFVVSCVSAALLLILSICVDRWLRHKGRLVPNGTVGDRILMGLTIVFAVVGTVGWISLSIFDIANHLRLHTMFLFLFIAGYLLSAIFICWEYQRLSVRNRDDGMLRISFWFKLVFAVVAVVLAIAFAATTWTRHYDASASLEWAIGFIFSLYILSFAIDLYPAIHTKAENTKHSKPNSRGTDREVEEVDQCALSSAHGHVRQTV